MLVVFEFVVFRPIPSDKIYNMGKSLEDTKQINLWNYNQLNKLLAMILLSIFNLKFDNSLNH